MGESGSTGWRAYWPQILVLVLLAVCALSYLPALSGEMLFDDRPLLEATDCWHGVEKIPAMFGFGESSPCTYRPVRYVTYALDYTIGGPAPLVLHISNLIYHLITAIAVFMLFRRWAGVGAAVLMMGLWALHPVHADSVAYISGRRDIISTLLFVLAYLQLSPPKDKKLGVLRVLLGLGLFVLAIRAKEMAVTLPAVLLWSVIATRAGNLNAFKAHLKRRWPVYAVLFAGAAVFVVYRAFLDSHSYMSGKWWGEGPIGNFATVFALYARYLWLVIWPAELIGDYFPVTIPLAESFGDPRTLLGIFLYAGLIVLVVVSLRRGWKATALGVGWFMITMLPVSHIFPHHELFAEHYLYLPMIGLAVAGLPLAERLLSTKRSRALVVAIAAMVMVAFTARTAIRAADYQSEHAFYSAAHEAAPDNLRNNHNLGVIYLEAEECDRALPLLLRAGRYLRRNASLSRGNLVRFLECAEQQGRSDIVNALTDELLRRFPADPLGLVWRARRALEAGETDRATEALMQVVGMERGENPETVALLAMAHNQANRSTLALGVLRQYPYEQRGHCEQEVRALTNLGRSFHRRALRRVQECLSRYPSSPILLELRATLSEQFWEGVP